MTRDLLARSREQAEHSAPPVRAAALLHISRVQTVVDPAEFRHTFEHGVAEFRRLEGFDRDCLLENAKRIAAAVAPDLVPAISHNSAMLSHFSADAIGRIMIEHGHVDAAFEYLMNYDQPERFPFLLIGNLMPSLSDPERKVAIVRRAVEAWRAGRGFEFINVYQCHWRLLPPDEALKIVREIVRVAIKQPDRQISSGYRDQVNFTSERQHTFFEVLHVLRSLDNKRAESLISKYPQLAEAVRRYPDGYGTVVEEAKALAKQAAGKSCGGGIMFGGSPADFDYAKSLLQAQRDGSFDPPLEHALERYREETGPENPNTVPREFWDSTFRFRSIIYAAGKRLGPDAAIYLDRIPDPDLRLFAQIEFAAALAGLPELRGFICHSPRR
jgi:hypothetical protein